MKILVFIIVGVTAALSGVMLTSQLMIVDGTLGVGLELQAIAVVVLGGTSLMGGNANLLGTLLAAVLLAVISSALNILKVEPFYQYLALGLLLIIALALDTLRREVIKRAVDGGPAVSAAAPPATGSDAVGTNPALRWFKRSLARYTIQYLLLVAVIVVFATNENSRQMSNILSVLLQASFIGIGAAGMTIVIINGAFDLSVAGMLGLCGVVIALLLPDIGIVPVFIVALALGGSLGVVNGLVVTKLKIPAFIATLGMMNIYLAAAFIITSGQVVAVSEKAFRELGTGKIVGVPIPFIFMLLTYLGLHVVMTRTTYGRKIRAVGSNEVAGRVGGLKVDRVRVFAFALLGICIGIAARRVDGLSVVGQRHHGPGL